MTVSPHPAKAPLDDHSASEILGYDKLHTRVVVADADEVRNTDFSGQFGGLYVRANAANYNLDTSNIDADDGVNVIIDGAGNHFIKAVDSAAPVLATYHDADISGGAITLGSEDIVVVKTTTSVNINL